MSMTNEASTYFEKIAPQWDAVSAGYFSEEVRRTALAKAYLHPGSTAADIGSGTGFIAAGLAETVKKVHVLDGSAAMLDVARKNLASFDNIEYHLSDSQSLALPDASVDAAFANMYLHHCPDPLAAIREMVRILKPGGRLVITDADTHTHTWMKEEMADIWLGFDRDQIRAWFQEAGLVNVIVDCTGENCCAQSANPEIANEKDQSAKISIFAASGTKRVSMRGEVEAHYGALAQTGCGCGSGTQDTGEKSASSCCSGSQEQPIDQVAAGYYSKDEMNAVPSDAGEFSLGCGNPTALAGLKPGEVVLDIGSGGGMDSFLAASRVGNTGRVIGVDMTPAMLERARRSAARNGIGNVEFRQGLAEALPVEDQTVDVILSNCVINLCEDKDPVFREAFRVLRPGGRLEVSDIVTSGSYPVEARQDTEGWSSCQTGALPENEYTDLIRQAGFDQIHVRRSQTYEVLDGVRVYSAIVSARKPDGKAAV
jgi:ubiquinone/menaquinone biosynthesis C-methylase UbiE